MAGEPQLWLHFPFSVLLMCTLEWLTLSGSCHLPWGPTWGLSSAWPSPGCCKHWGVNRRWKVSLSCLSSITLLFI